MPTLNNQQRRYLNEPRRNFEIIVSLVGFYWSAAMLTLWRAGDNPLSWLFGPETLHMALIFTVMIAAVTHSIGIRANGRWGLFSTSLRFAAMFCMALIALVLTFGGMVAWNSAVGAYPPYVMGAAYGLYGAFNDCRMARKGIRYA